MSGKKLNVEDKVKEKSDTPVGRLNESVDVKELAKIKLKKNTWLSSKMHKNLCKDIETLEKNIGNSTINKDEKTKDTRWEVNYGDLEQAIKAQCKEKEAADNMPVAALTLQLWCVLPKKMWEVFGHDLQFNQELQEKIRGHMELTIIKDWAELCDKLWNKGKVDEEDLEKAQQEFVTESGKLQTSWEKEAGLVVVKLFTEKANTFEEYRNYKFKAAGKLLATFGGIGLSVAALATAATPAAPATLAPAIIGLVQAVGSALTQIKNLYEEADTVIQDISVKLDRFEVAWKDLSKNWNKKSMVAKEAGTSFLASLTGDLSEIKFPSISGLLSRCGLLESKVGGLECNLHIASVGFGLLFKRLDELKILIESNQTYLFLEMEKGVGDPTKIEKARKALEELVGETDDKNSQLKVTFENIHTESNHIKVLKEWGGKYKTALEEAEKALGTKNVKLIISFVTALGTIGSGFASPPTEVIEKVMTSLGTVYSFAQTLNDFGEGVKEAVKKK